MRTNGHASWNHPSLLAAVTFMLTLAGATGSAAARPPAGDDQSMAVAAVYRRAEPTLRQAGSLYHASIAFEVTGPFAYAGTGELWADAERSVAREEREFGALGRQARLFTEEGRFTREEDGRVHASSPTLSRCNGVGIATSAVLGCPGPTERSTTAVELGRNGDRPAVVLVTVGESRGSDERITFTSRLYLDPETHLPFASEQNGIYNGNEEFRFVARIVYRHAFIPRDSVPAGFFTPGDFGYTPPDFEATLGPPSPDAPVYWLGQRLGGAGALPGLVLRGAFRRSPQFPVPYEVSLDYSSADDPFGPPILSLQQFSLATWETQLDPSRPGHIWNGPCWTRTEIMLSDRRATIFAGYSDAAWYAALDASPDPDACPPGARDRFLAHVYLGEMAIIIGAAGTSGPNGTTRSPYDTFAGMEAVARGLHARQ